MKCDSVPCIFPWTKKTNKIKNNKNAKKELPRTETFPAASNESIAASNISNCSDDFLENATVGLSFEEFKNSDEYKMLVSEFVVEEIVGEDNFSINDGDKQGFDIDDSSNTVGESGVCLKESRGENNNHSLIPCFSVNMFKNNDEALHFYTGLETYDKFLFVYRTLGEATEKLNYFYCLPPDHISPIDQFFLTLIILRKHKTYYELKLMFNTTEKQVYNIFITWIRFMKIQWSKIPIWPSKELVKFYSPHQFQDYNNVRVILDGTEIPIQKPSPPLAQQVTFSKYKNKNTVKNVVGITPGGLCCFISSSYGGSATDRQIIERSNISKLCDPGDIVLADKGFDIEDLLASNGVKLNIPSFFKKKSQISCETVKKDRKISSKRVHVERGIGLAKTYDILKGPLNGTETLLFDDIVYVCFMLCNFRKPMFYQIFLMFKSSKI